MADSNETVRIIRVQGRPEGLDRLSSELQKVRAAHEGLAQASDASAAATERNARRQLSAQNAWDRQVSRVDAAVRAQQQFDRELGIGARAFDQGIINARQYANEIERLQRQLERAGGALASGGGRSAAIDQQLSSRLAGPDFTRQLQAQFAEQEKQVQSIQKLRQQYDGLGVAEERYLSAVAETDQALKQGLITQAQHVTITTNAKRVLEDTTKAYNGAFGAQGKYTTGAGLARHELVNLSRQIQDVGVSLASGQSLMTVFIQQGTQIADVFASSRASLAGFAAQAARGVAGFALSGAGAATGGAIAGAGALYSAYRYAEAQTAVERALAGVGRASGATRDAINRQADAEAAAARVSVASAREILSAFAGTGRTNPNALPGLSQFASNYATQRNLDQGEASERLAKMFADPAKGALELQEELGGLSDVTLRYIRDMQAAGDRTAAARALLEVFSKSVEGATERGNFFAQTWRNIGNAVSNASDQVGKFVSGGASAQERLDELTRQRDQRGQYGLNTASRDAEIKRLQAIVELERQRAEIETRRAKADNASTAAGEILESLNPYAKALRDLQEQRSKLEEAIKLNPGTQGLEEWQRWSTALDQAAKSLLTTTERQQRLNDINVQAAQARTLAERTAVEVARLTLDLAGKTVEAKEREAIIQGKIVEMQAQANREARDALRASNDQRGLAGLRPFERQMREIEIRERDNRERFGGSAASALPASAAAANGLDNAFAVSLRQMAAAIPGITVTSGFRTYEQQAKLYADKPHLAAPPGRSQHERGMAADLAFATPEARAEAHRRAAEFGLTFPLKDRPKNPEPWHVEPIGGRNGGGAMGNSAASAIAANERAAATLEQYNSVIRAANDNITEQEKALQIQARAFFMSTEEAAKAQKSQELYNQFAQAGVPVTEGLAAAIEQTATRYGNLVRAQEEVRRSQEALKTVGDLGRDTLRGIYSDLRNGASGAEILTNALDRVANKLMDMALNDLFGKAFGNNNQGLFGNGGFINSLFGAFGVGGGGGFNFAGTAGGSFSQGAGGYNGAGPFFSGGGYTGAGGKYDAAGVVHRGEYVFDANATSRIGVDVLEAMRRGVPGYANGGYVSAAPYIHPQASNGNAPGAANWNVNVINNGRDEVRTEQRPDGSLDVIIGQVQGRIAQDVVRGRGSLNSALIAKQSNRQLKG